MSNSLMKLGYSLYSSCFRRVYHFKKGFSVSKESREAQPKLNINSNMVIDKTEETNYFPEQNKVSGFKICEGYQKNNTAFL